MKPVCWVAAKLLIKSSNIIGAQGKVPLPISVLLCYSHPVSLFKLLTQKQLMKTFILSQETFYSCASAACTFSVSLALTLPSLKNSSDEVSVMVKAVKMFDCLSWISGGVKLFQKVVAFLQQIKCKL